MSAQKIVTELWKIKHTKNNAKTIPPVKTECERMRKIHNIAMIVNVALTVIRSDNQLYDISSNATDEYRYKKTLHHVTLFCRAPSLELLHSDSNLYNLYSPLYDHFRTDVTQQKKANLFVASEKFNKMENKQKLIHLITLVIFWIVQLKTNSQINKNNGNSKEMTLFPPELCRQITSSTKIQADAETATKRISPSELFEDMNANTIFHQQFVLAMIIKYHTCKSDEEKEKFINQIKAGPVEKPTPLYQKDIETRNILPIEYSWNKTRFRRFRKKYWKYYTVDKSYLYKRFSAQNPDTDKVGATEAKSALIDILNSFDNSPAHMTIMRARLLQLSEEIYLQEELVDIEKLLSEYFKKGFCDTNSQSARLESGLTTHEQNESVKNFRFENDQICFDISADEFKDVLSHSPVLANRIFYLYILIQEDKITTEYQGSEEKDLHSKNLIEKFLDVFTDNKIRNSSFFNVLNKIRSENGQEAIIMKQLTASHTQRLIIQLCAHFKHTIEDHFDDVFKYHRINKEP